MDDPWWVTAIRLLAVVGMAVGAYEGFKRMRADKRAKDKAAEEPPTSKDNKG